MRNIGNFIPKSAILCLLTASVLARANADTIKAGLIAPLTGGGAQWGMAAAGGAKILADEVNATGGLEVACVKHQVELIALDDKYSATDAVAAYNRLVNQDGVKFVILVTSPATMALKQNVEDNKVLALTTAYTATPA